MILSFSVLACIDQSTQKKGHSAFLIKPRHNDTAASVGFDILRILVDKVLVWSAVSLTSGVESGVTEKLVHSPF